MVHVARGGDRGGRVDAELIDLRTLVPLDLATITCVGRKDGAVRRRARSTADVRLRGRGVGAGAATLFLEPGSADRPRHGLGHAVSARPGMAVHAEPRTDRAARCGRRWLHGRS